MTLKTVRERVHLGQSAFTVDAQGQRSSAERTASSGLAPTASRAAPSAHAPSSVSRVRNAWGLIVAPSRIASLSLMATRAPELVARHGSPGSTRRGKKPFGGRSLADRPRGWGTPGGGPGTRSRDINTFPAGNWTVRTLRDDAHWSRGLSRPAACTRRDERAQPIVFRHLMMSINVSTAAGGPEMTRLLVW